MHTDTSGQITNINRFEKHGIITTLVFLFIIFVVMDLIVGSIVLANPESGVRTADPNFHHGFIAKGESSDRWGEEPYTIITDSLGFKDFDKSDIPLTTNKHRILFMGDSFTEGIGVSYEKTFVGLLAKRLDPIGYDILYAGVASYAPTIYYLKTKYLIDHGLKFDELMVFDDLSDSQDELDEYKNWSPDDAKTLKAIFTNYFDKSDLFLSRHSLTYLHIIRPILFSLTGKYNTVQPDAKYLADRGRWPFDEQVFNDWGKKGLDIELEQMAKLYKLCKDNNIKMSVAVYPWPVSIKEDVLNSKQVTVWREFANEHNMDFYNFFPTFMSTTTPQKQIIDKYFIHGDVHWNAAGHALIAGEWLKQYKQKNNL